MKISILALVAATVVDAAASELDERTAKKVSIGEDDIPAVELRVLGASSGEESSHVAIAVERLADMAHLRDASEPDGDKHDRRRIEKRDNKEKRKRLGGRRLKVRYFFHCEKCFPTYM